ncbi:MAG: hemerythrin domain-containing protein [Pseudomonadota bacterium]
MSQTIERLRTDHQRLRAVLNTISAVSDDMSKDDFDTQSDHLFCLVDYLSGYPEHLHHPTEDLVFDKMLELDLTAEQQEKVEWNRAQHKVLSAATSELMDMVEAPPEEVDISAFKEQLEHFVSIQRQHMAFEEEEIFPLALETISSNNWATLDDRFGSASDPLFDEADRRYAALFRFLVPGDEHLNAELAEPLMRYLAATGGTPGG